MTEAVSGGMAEGAKAIVALQRQIATATKPVVVELGGPVRAGGVGIVGAADIVIAAESVTFQLTEVRLGLAAAVISLSLIPRFSDRAAADLFLTARKFDAAEAAQVGLVTRAVPDTELQGEIGRVLIDLCKAYPQGSAREQADPQPRPGGPHRRLRRRGGHEVGRAVRQRRGPRGHERVPRQEVGTTSGWATPA